jgi:hypothetical protein
MGTPRTRWTDQEETTLTYIWAETGMTLPRMAARLPGRSIYAIVSRARRLGLGALSQRTWSMKGCADYLGYDIDSVVRAVAGLKAQGGQGFTRWTERVPVVDPHKIAQGIHRGTRYIFDDDQVDQIHCWIQEHARAATRIFGPNGPHPACKDCGRTDIRHAGHGLCAACLMRAGKASGARPRTNEEERRRSAAAWSRPCAMCGSAWQQIPHRGRPARICPECQPAAAVLAEQRRRENISRIRRAVCQPRVRRAA